ncbi:MAG: trigger factor [Methylomonas sp.]|jgi:trigger factor|uniref:trigger factor n=1 Tax=Methylomonas sp. TaxID=418 RepID=UPI0025DB2F27|nr:trigger factor [Methylomonas sp.]MCK9606677.1 trigger factor [Methylomonas sp.]
MQVSVEKTSELSRKMIVSVPDAVLQEKMETRFKKLAREVKVDGFRPGKVPTSMVKKLYGERVKQEVAGDLIQTTYFEALQQQELVPAGHPSITPAEKSEGFEYVAEFEVYPEISLDAVNGLEVSRPTASVTDADVEKMIDKLKQQKQAWAVVERASQEGDRVTIHFSGVSEGENFTDGKVENYAIEIGGNQMIPGFEDELKGLSVGESKTFSITFPEKYNSEKLAGKVAEFEIEMVKVEAAVLPELDAEFIKAYGVEDGDVESFRTDVKDNMERELAQGLKNKLKTAVMDALFANVQITLPNALIDQEIQALMKPYAERAGKAKLKLEDLNLPQDMFENQAKRRVALGLILGEIIQKNDIKVDADKVRATIEDMAKSYEKPEDVINWYYADNSRLNDVQQMVLEDQAVAWVIERARVVDQSVGFEDVMDRQQA